MRSTPVALQSCAAVIYYYLGLGETECVRGRAAYREDCSLLECSTGREKRESVSINEGMEKSVERIWEKTDSGLTLKSRPGQGAWWPHFNVDNL